MVRVDGPHRIFISQGQLMRTEGLSRRFLTRFFERLVSYVIKTDKHVVYEHDTLEGKFYFILVSSRHYAEYEVPLAELQARMIYDSQVLEAENQQLREELDEYKEKWGKIEDLRNRWIKRNHYTEKGNKKRKINKKLVDPLERKGSYYWRMQEKWMKR